VLNSYCFSSHGPQHILKITSSWIGARVDAFDHGLSHLVKDLGAFVNVFALIMCPFVFILELNTLGLLNVPTDKNLNDSGSNVFRLYLEYKVFASVYILIWIFLLDLVWGTHSWSLFKYFRCILRKYANRVRLLEPGKPISCYSHNNKS